MAGLPVSLVRFHDDADLQCGTGADSFCPRCSNFLSQDYKDSKLYRVPWEHSRLSYILKSSRSGCHLCSLLNRSIQVSYATEGADTSIYLFLVDDVLRVQVGTDAGRYTPLLKCQALSGNEQYQRISKFRRDVPGSLRIFEAVSQIMQWIEECRSNHTCCHLMPVIKLPTRLLKVSIDKVSVVETGTQALHQVQYLTLSHRWPKSPGMKLTKNTVITFKHGVLLNTLPPLFRDVCQLSLIIGYHYVWIDALCIVQDDHQDWLTEAALMVDVYSNSQLNVIAGSSQQHESLFSPRDTLALTPCVIKGSKISQNLNLHTIASFNSDEMDQIAKLPTDKRAWILQECELSPRMVYFGSTELVWECSTNLQCESSREGGINWSVDGSGPVPQNVRSKVARFQRDFVGLTEARCQSIWTGLVSKYTSLDMTFDTDRLVAISGLSQYLQQTAETKLGKYYAGLWELGFEQQLMWRSDATPDVRLPSTYLAPSWSWASHTSRVSYFGSPGGARSVSSFLESLDVATTSMSDRAPHGRMKSGYFTCLANLCRVYLSYENPSRSFFWSIDSLDMAKLVSDRTRLTISIVLDHSSDIYAKPGSSDTYQDFFLLPLICYDLDDHGKEYVAKPHCRRLFTAWTLQNSQLPKSDNSFPRGRWGTPLEAEDHYAMAALIMSPVPGSKGCFRRRGIAEFDKPETIRSLQQACEQTSLSPDRYITASPDRSAYEIVVV